jgi:agmatinase
VEHEVSVALLGIPYDAGFSYQRGAARGPEAIRRALHNPSTNNWTESLLDVMAGGVLEDVGDLAFGSEAAPRATIEAGVSTLLDRGAVPLLLGGDHSITYPILRAIRARHRRLTVLHIDAHPDLYQSFGGDPYSHASPFARVLKEGLVDRLVQVGIRTNNPHQNEQAARYGVEMVTMQDLEGRPWRLESVDPVYLSLDLDGLDPAFAPGVSHPEPGGLTTRQAIGLIQSIPAPLIGADLVEYNPDNDVRDLTARVAAKLVKEIVAKMAELDGGATRS